MAKRAKPTQSAKPVRARTVNSTSPDANRLLHELEVHQTELQSQNEELRLARRDLEAALSRYTELFDFAPLGYAALDARDVIRQVNHIGARLLGNNRTRI